MSPVATRTAPAATASERIAEPRTERVVRSVLAVVAAVLVVLAVRAPVWEARLDVLQYPGRPLVLTAYGDRLDGDVDEVEVLNHYVGLHVFDMAELQEVIMWVPAVVAALVCVAVAWWRPRRWVGGPRLAHAWIGTGARVALWLIPIGILADIQFRLYQLGHSMDPGAAFRQEPFTPWVVGEVQVASNVRTTAWPGRAVVMLLVAAAIMTFAMSLYRFGRQLAGLPAGERS